MGKDIATLMEERVLIFDGAMGTALQTICTEGDGNLETMVLTHPQAVKGIHEAYLSAGAHVLTTHTFSANPLILKARGLQDQMEAINAGAAALAREVAQKYTTPQEPRYVAGSLGPGSLLPSLGQQDFDGMEEAYARQSLVLLQGGVDCLLIETCQDILQAKAALTGARKAMNMYGGPKPILLTITLEEHNAMLLGTSLSAALTTILPFKPLAFGINCGRGPAGYAEAVAFLAEHSPLPLIIQPNAGLPKLQGGQTIYHQGAHEFAREMMELIPPQGVNILGGCCGCGAEHIQKLKEMANALEPRTTKKVRQKALSSLYISQEIPAKPPPFLIGERLNATGSREFRACLKQGDEEGILDIALQQQDQGAHCLDINTALPGRCGQEDMVSIISSLNTGAKVPLSIDCQDPHTIERALQRISGRPLINSVSLEDREKACAVMDLARKYGAALVCLTIDEEGIPLQAEGKMRAAQKLYELALKRGLTEDQLFFDPLTFSLATGKKEYRDAARETLKALPLLKASYPHSFTILGISNISYGLGESARILINSIFLHLAVEAGLDCAIVHPGAILPRQDIPGNAWQAGLNLMKYSKDHDDALATFLQLNTPEGGVSSPGETSGKGDMGLEEAILAGKKEELPSLMEKALAGSEPLDVLTELLEAMEEAGNLFARGELPLPLLLRCAESMERATELLTPHMPQGKTHFGRSVLLATVEGDIHDIGKNLVDSILRNHGYQVVNLGVDQSPQAILNAIREHEPEFLGLSGLLIQSCFKMKEVVEVLAQADETLTVLCGGAAVTAEYIQDHVQPVYSGVVQYARDPLEAIHIMDTKNPSVPRRTPEKRREEGVISFHQRPHPPQPPFWGRCVQRVDAEALLPFLQEEALFYRHWKYRRGASRPQELRSLFSRLWEQSREENLLQLKGVYGYFPAWRENNTLHIRHGEREITLPFPAPGGKKEINPRIAPIYEEKEDVLAICIVTLGPWLLQRAEALYDRGELQQYFHLYGLGEACTEAGARYLEARIQKELSLGKEGRRYSFGFPGCPPLAKQKDLFTLLQAESLGISLTESYQMIPEFSVSALYIHHPQSPVSGTKEGGNSHGSIPGSGAEKRP